MAFAGNSAAPAARLIVSYFCDHNALLTPIYPVHFYANTKTLPSPYYSLADITVLDSRHVEIRALRILLDSQDAKCDCIGNWLGGLLVIE